MDLVWVVPVSGILAVLVAAFLAWDVMRRDTGPVAMQEVAGAIYEGAMAFLGRQYRTIGMLAVVGAVAISALLAFLSHNADPVSVAWHTGVSFVAGSLCSALAGFIGMIIAVRSNLRSAAAARRSLGEALTIALRGGAVSGLLVVALSLLGVFALFVAFGGLDQPSVAPSLIVGFGFGASFVALFAQLGGGIYTKAADVGADLVGKVEAGIPEDDPRNPAVIADLVGDNVGDCAGRGADLFESTAAENIGAMILGVGLYTAAVNANQTPAQAAVWIFFPLIVRSFGLIASILGIFAVRPGGVRNAQRALDIGYYVTAGVSIVGMFAATQILPGAKIWFFLCGLVGIVMSIAFVYITQYYTSGSWRPVQEIANASRTGPATNIIAGIAIGLENTAIPALVISLALGISYWLGTLAAGDLNITGITSVNGGIYGTAIATMGMLMSAGYILAMDTFGPITDNAGGIVEMSDQPEEVRHVTDELDSVGNTTKALTKGYAIGSAALAAFLLFSAFLDEVHLALQKRVTDGLPVDARLMNGRELAAHLPVDLSRVEVFIGGFLGAMLVFLFSAFAIRAVGKAAGDMIEEVRRQFRADPGIMAGTSKPSYRQCVDISTRAALREMILPGILAVGAPVLAGLILGWEGAAAFLMVGTMAGILLATVLNNGGGAWDNAKKFIESGQLKSLTDGTTLGKGTPEHAAAVVGDTVGDPFKDTAGPSLHVLIKLLSTITLVLAPLFI